MVAVLLGRAEPPQQPIPYELVRMSAVLQQDRHDQTEELVEVRHDLAGSSDDVLLKTAREDGRVPQRAAVRQGLHVDLA